MADVKKGSSGTQVSKAAAGAAGLEQRLNDPNVAQSLNRLLDRLDSVAFFVESMDGFVRRGETIVDSISSTVDELRHSQASENMELLQKTPQMLKTGSQLAEAAAVMDLDRLNQSKVLERLTDASTLEALNTLLDQLPLVSFLMQALSEFMERGEVVADNLAEVVQELHLKEMDPAKVIKLMESLPKLQEAGDKLLASDLLGENLHKLMDAGTSVLKSGMLDEHVVNRLGELGKQTVSAYDEAISRPTQPIGGLFAMLRAMKDPDVQKVLGFGLSFAKAFAKNIK